MSEDNDNNDGNNNKEFNFQDFMKNYANSLKTEDYFNMETGEIDYDKIKAESNKVLKEMMDGNLDHISENSKDKKYTLLQDFETEEGLEEFNDLVKEHNLKREIEVIDHLGEDYVNETWKAENNIMSIKRFYKLDLSIPLGVLNIDEQIDLFENKELEEAKLENYEKASEMRDCVKQLKLKSKV